TCRHRHRQRAAGAAGAGGVAPLPPVSVWPAEEAAPSTSPVLLRMTRRALAELLPSRASQPSTSICSPLCSVLRFQPALCSMCGGPSSRLQFTTLPVLASATSIQKYTCGLVHSMRVTTPASFTGFFESYCAAKE